ncbi:nuclease-related domain-containing protein, partial [Cupriavidus sp. 8B]
MLVKKTDEKVSQISALEALIAAGEGRHIKHAEEELRKARAGIKGEQEAAYLIDFHFEKSKNTAVVHDLRLEIGGRVAQIDHLLVHRTLNVFVLETKRFHAGFKITDEGEFLRWNDWKKTYEGMPSPLAQNERHIAVLQDVFSEIEMPTRLGIRLAPTIHNVVVVSPNARVDRSRSFDSSRIIKADALSDFVSRCKPYRRHVDETYDEAVEAWRDPVARDGYVLRSRSRFHSEQPW